MGILRSSIYLHLAFVLWVCGPPTLQGSETSFAGRWNFRIEGTGDTFSTGWLQLQAAGDGLAGDMVWKWGSVTPIKNARIDGETLTFERDRDRFEAHLVDGNLHGTAKIGNEGSFSFSGKRASEMCDMSGTWKVRLTSRPDSTPGTIQLKSEDNEISGKLEDPQGNSYSVQHPKLVGRRLTFQAAADIADITPRDVELEIQGDRCVGTVSYSADGEVRVLDVEGRREREWGEPIELLQEDSLDGWLPRDPSKKFGWKVTDGVLENSPPDVDIMSEAKFRDFDLRLEYLIDPGSNSGVYLRGRYELQILGDTQVQDHGNMAVYSRLKPNKNPLKLGEWNQLEVTFVGRWLTVTLNGQVVHDNEYLPGPTGGAWDPDEELPGPLLLQGDHGKVRYRNIVVRPAIN